MLRKKVLVIGELNVDILLNGIASFPELGKEILAEDMKTVLGSSSAIFAANLAALGNDVSFCGAVGNDETGRFVIAELQAAGVKTHFTKQAINMGTGATLLLNYGQDRAAVTYCGAMDDFGIHDIPWQEVQHFDHVHLSNFFVQKNLRKDILQILRRLKTKGVTTSLDLQWDVKGQWDFEYKIGLDYVDIFMPNERELFALTKTNTLDDAIHEIKPYAHFTALKMGEMGSMGIYDEKQTFIEAFTMGSFVDAIGAGDSYNAGFIHKYLQDAPYDECLKMGNITGAISTTAAGGTAAFKDKIKTEQKINELLALHKI